MYIGFNSIDFGQILSLFFAIIIGLLVIAGAIYFFLKKKDNSAPLQYINGKILEKPIKQGNVEWYVVECENGERLKLRSFQANKLLISIGDEGLIGYQGQTIKTFQRK